MKFDYADHGDARVHSGVLKSMKILTEKNSRCFHAVRRALEENPSFGLILVSSEAGGFFGEVTRT